MTEPAHRVVPETSSGPLKIPAEQELLFREVLQFFEQRKVRYAVAGAFAMQQHTGIFRDTKDLDLFLTAESAAAALSLLQSAGFECEICDPVWLFKAKRGEYFVDLITGMSNATIVVDDSWIQRARPATVYDVSTCVLAAEELLASKLFVTRRERFDGADIAHIIYGTRGELDWARLLQLAGDNWEMLFWALVLFRYVYPGQTSFVPLEVWRDLMHRYESLISQPDPKAEFRGSLIDDKMFAIDLNEWGLNNLMQAFRERRMQNLPMICQRQ
ncbi:MAG: nucleotidyltransferase [Candidatus Sulfotelmatobacter sp.]